MLGANERRVAVHFGAGNIGRGFIGQMLSRSGFEVVFVARNEEQVALLKQQRQYTVTLASEREEEEIVRNVTAVHIRNAAAVKESIAEADVVTTAVGESALPHIARPLAEGIEFRLANHERPLRIIACENAVKGSSKLRKWVYSHLTEAAKEKAERCVVFPNAIVDRIVPPQIGDDTLGVKVEPFSEWLVEHDHGAGREPLSIAGVQYVRALEPYAERKLYTVNAGHCCAAYLGYLAGYRTIPEAMRDERIRRAVEGVMRETGRLLVHRYNWNEEEHLRYIRKSLQRFANPRINDKVTRVARSPLRKLAASDRLVRPAVQASALGMEIPHLVSLISAALLFDFDQDPEAVRLQSLIRDRGVRDVIRNHMGIHEHHPLHYRLTAHFEKLREGRRER